MKNMKNKVLSLLLALFVCVSGVACAATYTADGQGMIGAVTVTVDYADGKINAVTVDAHNETAGISDPAIARIPVEIVEKQSIAVDTVAGATMTSKAILSAVEAALTAAGAHMVLFTTGRGTPFGAPAPTMKIATNTPLATKKHGWIDFNAGVVADGTRTLDEAGADLLELVLEVASGKQTKTEQKGYREISIFKDGVVL